MKTCVPVLACLALLWGSAAHADQLADLLLTLRIRQVLQQDPVLAPAEVGVTVRHRIVRLWGPIPSRELSVRAETRVRSLAEVDGIRNDLQVLPEDLFQPPPIVPLAPVLPAPPAPARPPLPFRPAPTESAAKPALVPTRGEALALPAIRIPIEFLGLEPR